jgi:hypothetical protein
MTTMRAVAVGVVLVAALCIPGYGQFSNCTTMTMTPTGESTKCTIPYPHYKWTAYPLTDSVSYLDVCVDDNSGGTYFSNSSTISGNGGCMYGGDNQTLNQCGMSVATNMVYSLVAGQPNAMYLQGWDQAIYCITSGGFCTGNGYSCERQGNFEQDIKYCNVITCTTCKGTGWLVPEDIFDHDPQRIAMAIRENAITPGGLQ